MSNDKTIKSLDILFKPHNVVILEAKEKFFYFIEGFKSQGFNLTNLYLINSSATELFGLKCYKSIKDIPVDVIDLLILTVNREKIIKTLKEALEEKEIRFIHFFTAGTGEADKIGKEIETEIKEILENTITNTRAIGPNCMGVYCPDGKNSYFPIFPTKSGNIGLIFHSGDLHSRTIGYGAIRYNLRFSKGVSVGNCISLQISDFLEYMDQDKETDIIGIYFEGFSPYRKFEGRRIFNLLKNIKKPVLLLRGGKTTRGQAAVLTHTGSLGTEKRIWEALYKQTPIIEVGSSLDEFLDYLYMFYEFYKKYQNKNLKEQIQLFPKGKNALVILWSGGFGILATDTLSELGLNMPLFEGKTKEKLLEVHPNFKVGSLSNPLDLPWIASTQEYLDICRLAISENIDIVLMMTDRMGGRSDERVKRSYENLLKIKKFVESLNKILVIILSEYPDKDRNRYYMELLNDGFMVYPDIRRAAKSFLILYEYGQKLKRIVNL
jgi:acetyl-CoA synthetase (ADP-forming)